MGTVVTIMSNITPLPNVSAGATGGGMTVEDISFETSTPIMRETKRNQRALLKKKLRYAPQTSQKAGAAYRRRFRRSSHIVPDFKKYILAVHKSTNPSMMIGSKTVAILNGFLGDVLERMTDDAKQLSQTRGGRTLSETDMQAVARLMLPTGMARDGQAFAARCVADYQTTVENRARRTMLKRKTKIKQ